MKIKHVFEPNGKSERCECGVRRITRSSGSYFEDAKGNHCRQSPECTRQPKQAAQIEKPIPPSTINEKDVLLVSLYEAFVKNADLDWNSVKGNVALMTRELLKREKLIA